MADGETRVRRLLAPFEALEAARGRLLPWAPVFLSFGIGAYFAALGRVDALVFTAGVGQNSALVRQMACDGLGALGVRLDDAKNAAAAGDISEIQAVDSPVCVLVIATNEELEIARQTVSVIRS